MLTCDDALVMMPYIQRVLLSYLSVHSYMPSIYIYICICILCVYILHLRKLLGFSAYLSQGLVRSTNRNATQRCQRSLPCATCCLFRILTLANLMTPCVSRHDSAVFRVCAAAKLPGWDVLAVMASSWTVFLFYGRTFSNVGETFWVTLAAVVATAPPLSLTPDAKAVAFGLVTGIALFTRFTYLAFAFPFGIVMLLLNLIECNGNIHSSNSLGPKPSFFKIVRHLLSGTAVLKCVWWTALTALSVLPAAATLIQLDTLYHKSELSATVNGFTSNITTALLNSSVEEIVNRATHGILSINMAGYIETLWGHAIVTPVNLFVFNSNATNLEQFGLHPWWMHAVVNVQVLYGPLALIALLCTLFTAGGFYTPFVLMNVSGRSSSKGRRAAAVPARAAIVRAGLIGSSLCGLAVLSIAPHQEPRFLLPAGLGFTALAAPWLWQRGGKVMWWSWCIFNLSLGGFYAFVHQAGVVPSLRDHSVSSPHHHLVYYASYMPPRSMAGARGNTVYDFHKAENLEELGDMFTPLIAQLRKERHLPTSRNQADGGANQVLANEADGGAATVPAPILSVALPGSVNAHAVSKMLTERHQVSLDTVNLTAEYAPHFSGEHPPHQLSDLTLRVYRAVIGVISNDGH